jgi:pimeloyl-ACP methyl ester carboxylesterase
MMQRHAISTISVFGYSWGSFQAAWLVKLMPIEIDHVYLIDPVTLFMQYCGIPYSFIFKPPTNVSDQIFHLFYRKNVSLSNIIQNHFAWYNMVLYFSDFPKNMGVFISISGKDCFLDGPQAIRRTQHWANANADTRTAPTQVLYQENKSHGDVLDQVDVLQSIARGTIYTQ